MSPLSDRIGLSAKLLPCLWAFLIAAGCSQEGTYLPVTGSVLVDGQPAAGASVVFHLEGGDMHSIPASGIVGDDGTFTLTTGLQTGAPAGTYHVTVVWPDTSQLELTDQELMMGASIYDGPDRLKGKYAIPHRSGLRVVLSAADRELPPFDLRLD